jgi:diguanylate cyclase (GGDEF)-like protein/PAS domain S-box-containing protein
MAARWRIELGEVLLSGSYDYRLVALSVALAMVAAYAALDLAGRVTAMQGWAQWFWLAGGATSMGFGIWAMHYIGMLAFTLPVPVVYHYPTVALSLLAAVSASAVALFTVSRERMSTRSLWIGGTVMGGGIAAMHYIGMAAMRLPAMMRYRPAPFLLSCALAIAVSLAALLLSFHVRLEQKTTWRKILSALIMGSAIPLMHYTGMWAVSFHSSDIPVRTESTLQISSLGILAISLISFQILALAIVTAFLDRILSMRNLILSAARDGEARLRMLAEAIPLIVWTSTSTGEVDYCNRRWYELTGFTEEQTLGAGWANGLHPEDRPVAYQNWEKVLRTGEPFEMKYRVRTAAGNFLWHLVRATPVRDSTGAIITWFGSCTDIDGQMRDQEILEDKVKKYTSDLIEANALLQSEMRERSLAQQELNEQSERMLRELTTRSNRATNLAKMAELLQGCATEQDACSVVTVMAEKIFPELRGALLLSTPSRETLELAATWTDCILPEGTFGPKDCWALRTGHAHIVPAADRTVECHHAATIRSSYFCLPLLAHGEAIGILHFQLIGPVELNESMLLVANTLAEQIGLSVANIRLREALRNQSIRDPLTGLYNRRYLEDVMARLARRSMRAGQSLGILMLDLDNFKQFNDTYGHDAGDTVLRETASLLLKSVRAEDVVCRFGGEEFVALLPMADLKATQARAEDIREKLHSLSVMHQGRSLGIITVSVGVAGLPQHGGSPRELLEAADAALYRSKKEGRDRVTVAETPAPAAARTQAATAALP